MVTLKCRHTFSVIMSGLVSGGICWVMLEVASFPPAPPEGIAQFSLKFVQYSEWTGLVFVRACNPCYSVTCWSHVSCVASYLLVAVSLSEQSRLSTEEVIVGAMDSGSVMRGNIDK